VLTIPQAAPAPAETPIAPQTTQPATPPTQPPPT
jgi:hypothetical protein